MLNEPHQPKQDAAKHGGAEDSPDRSVSPEELGSDAPSQSAQDVQAQPPGSLGRLRQIYHGTLIKQGRAGGFFIAASFLLTTLAARGITHAIRDQRFTFLFRNVSSRKGLHFHHSLFGILGLLGVGYTDLRFRPRGSRKRRALDIFYGTAAALTLDEFALWLRLSDVYWSPEGRESIDALILASAVLSLTVEGLGFWRALWCDTIWLLFRRGTPYPEIEAPTVQRPH